MTAVESRLSRARANALGWTEEPSSTRRRRPGRIVAGVVLLIVSGWIAAAVYLSVGSREEVVAVARPVGQFQELTADDLRVVRVASDPDVALVPAAEMDEKWAGRHRWRCSRVPCCTKPSCWTKRRRW